MGTRKERLEAAGSISEKILGWKCSVEGQRVYTHESEGQKTNSGFYSLKEAQIVIELWREEYNTRRPHSALDYRPPAPGACNPFLPPEPISQPQAVM